MIMWFKAVTLLNRVERVILIPGVLFSGLFGLLINNTTARSFLGNTWKQRKFGAAV
jgi:hypothetical protein